MQNKEIQTKTSSNISMILMWKGECSIPISYLIPVQSTAKTHRKFLKREVPHCHNEVARRTETFITDTGWKMEHSLAEDVTNNRNNAKKH